VQGEPAVRLLVEIIRLEQNRPPRVLHSFIHSAFSVRLVRESMKAVVNSPSWPHEANGFRILAEVGTELYRFSRDHK
jgi:hypothetical protein